MEVSYFCHPLDVVAMGHSRYPDGVKFIVASFENYFGNVTGTDLRTWCIRHSWVLAWTHVALGDPRRLIDPVVAPATKVNASLSAAYVAAFSSLWSQAQSSWNASQMNLQNHTHWKVRGLYRMVCFIQLKRLCKMKCPMLLGTMFKIVGSAGCVYDCTDAGQ